MGTFLLDVAKLFDFIGDKADIYIGTTPPINGYGKISSQASAITESIQWIANENPKIKLIDNTNFLEIRWEKIRICMVRMELI